MRHLPKSGTTVIKPERAFATNLICCSEIPCVSEEQSAAATKNPRLKLLFRLCDFKISDESKSLVA
jgi:hypothetical protein